ncbi:MAG: hypothetical protein R3C19_08005 [Planctomycetaceae bacterium]
MADTYPLQPPSGPSRSSSGTPDSASIRSGREKKKPAGRLVSLDAFRGFIMTMLAAEGFGLADFSKLPPDSAAWNTCNYEFFHALGFHFDHPAWESIFGWMGVSFWDLIQPAFMFMVGVAMPFSYARREAMGESRAGRMLHAAIRAVILVLLGVFLYSLNNARTNWIFPNVLAQIGLGYFFAYLLLGRRLGIQLGAFAAILVGYWLFFFLNPPPADHDYAAYSASADEGEIFEGRFAPWSKNANIAFRFDQWLLPQLRTPKTDPPAGDNEKTSDDTPTDEVNIAPADKPGLVRQWFFSNPEPYTYNRGGYTTLNFIPSIGTAVLGILCGQLLLTNGTSGRKLLILIVAGALCLGLGILAHHTVCPIVKRIWTPSWVLFSGGYVIWMLAGFFLLFDVLPLKKLAFPLVVVGMNSLVMYLLGEMLRPWTGRHIVETHCAGFLESVFGPGILDHDVFGRVTLPTATFVVFWLIAFWLYRNRWFVRV